ncbi:MAG: hypothetical protein FOGNACKC_03549 [Anaerolineae bacterium]|nr:hypothetical protein [Anaerolineae bacterium]
MKRNQGIHISIYVLRQLRLALPENLSGFIEYPSRRFLPCGG